jgi:hypothetical protein
LANSIIQKLAQALAKHANYLNIFRAFKALLNLAAFLSCSAMFAAKLCRPLKSSLAQK